MVLLDARRLVIDVQRGCHPLGNHSGAETARSGLGDPAPEDELELIGTPQVKVFADDLLEEDAYLGRSVQDLREREFRL